jgi:hypothetical protein
VTDCRKSVDQAAFFAGGREAVLSLGLCLLEEVEGDVAYDGHVVRTLSGAQAREVLVEGDVEDQWRSFSMPQCERAAAARRTASAGVEAM